MLDRLRRACLNGSCPVVDIVSDGLGTVDGLAVDFTGPAVYWTDTQCNEISVVSLVNTTWRAVLVSQHLDSPRAIALHYTAGSVSWQRRGIGWEG